MTSDHTPFGRSAAWWIAASLSLALVLLRVLLEGTAEGIDSFRYLRSANAILADGVFDAERYPPGFPLLLAAADVAGLPPWTVTTGAALALAVLVWWAAVRVGGPPAGIAAGLFGLLSGLIGEAGVLLMSDTPAAVLVAAALVAALHDRWAIAGALLATSAWIRLPHALFAVAAGTTHRRMVATAASGLLALVLFNLLVFGSLSTYRSDQAAWALSYFSEGLYLDDTATPYGNGYFYGAVFSGAWGLLVPLAPVAAAFELWHRRSERAARFATAIVVLNVATYVVYFYQSARFVLPAATVLVIYAASWVSRMAEDLWRGRRQPTPPRSRAQSSA